MHWKNARARAFTYLSFTLGIAFAYFRESLIRALILLSIVGRQDRKGITSSMGKPNPGIPSQQPTSAYRESRLRQVRLAGS